MATVNDAIVVFGSLAAELSQLVQEALAAESCTLEEWWVIDCLAQTDVRAVSEIAAEVKVSGGALTKVIDRLVINNIAYRRIDPTDRRRINVRLTIRGRKVHRTLADIVERCDYIADTDSLKELVDTARGLQRAPR